MKLKRSLLGLVLIAAVLSACVGNPPPELKPYYTAEAVLIRVQELQKLTNNLYDQKLISPERTKLIVTFTRSAAVVLEDSKAGWQEIVKESWSTLKKSLATPESQLKTLYDILDAMMGAIQ